MKRCLIRVVMQTHLSSHLSFPGEGNTLVNGNLCHLYALLLRRRAESSPLSAVVFQLPSAQHNQYANVAYFELACTDPLQKLKTAGLATITLG